MKLSKCILKCNSIQISNVSWDTQVLSSKYRNFFLSLYTDQENSPPFENMELESNKDLRCVTMEYNASYPENTTFLITNCNEKHKGMCITGILDLEKYIYIIDK